MYVRVNQLHTYRAWKRLTSFFFLLLPNPPIPRDSKLRHLICIFLFLLVGEHEGSDREKKEKKLERVFTAWFCINASKAHREAPGSAW